MARLAAVEKGEYYPTPLSIVDTISQTIDIKDGRGVIRLFDPCAGEGLALERLAALLQHRAGRPVETWGVEISPDRARQAAKRLDTARTSAGSTQRADMETFGACVARKKARKAAVALRKRSSVRNQRNATRLLQSGGRIHFSRSPQTTSAPSA